MEKKQQTGMRGVYLVAAELSRLGLITSTTSRSAIGADILATDNLCSNSFSVQVKTNATTFNFWLVGKKSKEIASPTHIYVFVNLHNDKDVEFYIVPSVVVAEKTRCSNSSGSSWCSFSLKYALVYKDKWDIFLKH
jgi:hypothetical protein